MVRSTWAGSKQGEGHLTDPGPHGLALLVEAGTHGRGACVATNDLRSEAFGDLQAGRTAPRVRSRHNLCCPMIPWRERRTIRTVNTRSSIA
jgi:hypothetical protein